MRAKRFVESRVRKPPKIMNYKTDKSTQRLRRRMRIRAKVFGTPERPRLSVFRSNKFTYAQLIDDVAGVTIASASTKDSKEKSALAGAVTVGKKIADEAAKKNVKKVVFDRGGYIYTGRIKAVAEGAREGGLEF